LKVKKTVIMSSSRGKSMLRGVAFVACAVALGMAAPKTAEADLITVPLYLGSYVAVGCSNAGGSQDVAKTPVLKNTTGATITAGHTLFWKSSDGDSGSVKLASDLVPNAWVEGMGHPGNAYSCTSNFTEWSDLKVQSAAFTGLTTAQVTVANIDPFVDAGASVTRVQVVSCSGPVLASMDLSPIAIGKGQSKVFNVTFRAQSGRKYLHIVADVNKQVIEGNEQNNVWDDEGTCIR
jgi:hypothetical protein